MLLFGKEGCHLAKVKLTVFMACTLYVLG